MSGKATAMKSLKEKWLSIVQSAEEKGEKGIGGPSTVTKGVFWVTERVAELWANSAIGSNMDHSLGLLEENSLK